jgi:Arc/MetJ-type ribon-helix-helix transcriptional regulator
MKKTVKFAVSMPEETFKRLESLRRKTGRTRSQFIRELLRAWEVDISSQSGVEEEAAVYKKDSLRNIFDPEEIRKRALEAAGRFQSGLPDLSLNHDQYLEDSYDRIAAAKSSKKRRTNP